MIFWATWCPYCKAFMPYLKQIQSDYADKGVKIIAVNAKERGIGDPQAYVQKLGFPLIAVRDGDSIADAVLRFGRCLHDAGLRSTLCTDLIGLLILPNDALEEA
ncbi:MAG TPA: TlpA disulfide reductase family protein [Gammaproteobacteria bacterium]|nr:TlpA disulfide reductase family protein [Gammaproteobacteria bacterium]